MKKFKLLLVILSFTLLPLLAGFGLSVLTGCNTPQSAAYKTAATTQVTVDTAMHLWGAYVTAQKVAGTPVPVAQEQAVKAAYQKFQAAMVVACDVGAVWSASSVTNNSITGPANAFAQAVVNANQTITDLTALIASFGVKLQ